MLTIESILKDTFGYDSFRPLQREVIANVLAGRDTLAVMPTGGGKSLCYQIPAILQEGLTVVVSPLIALMKDQVEQLHANGVPAVVLNSSLSAAAYQKNMDQVRAGAAKLLYVAPETLLTGRIFSLLAETRLALLTIDEAHCISEWGHDFRPEYRQIMDVRQRYPQATCLALTATATPRVRADIKSSLNFSQSNEFVASFNRENLYIEVAPKTSGVGQVVRFLEDFRDQSGIIYCFSRRQVDELAAYLALKGFSVRPYHAGLDDEERQVNQEAFIRDDVQIMVATIAFGMGINKPNVRFVVHFDLPKSIEGYYQEIGRAGRDGLPAHCLLLYSEGDAGKQRYFINQKEGEERLVAAQHLEALIRYAEDQLHCRRQPLLAYFGERYAHQNCQNCDHCLSAPVELTDITIPAQKFLSCVKRTGERFGAAHVTAVLRGSKNEKVLRSSHDKLSTYGIGGELSQKQWMHLSRQLVQMGYLQQWGEYRTLRLTDQALDALRNRTPIKGILKEESASRKARKDAGTLKYDQALFGMLRSLRKQLADEAGVPPYVIFSDRTLTEMSAFYPQSAESLLKINGVGQVKLSQYGAAFLEAIQRYCAEQQIPEKHQQVRQRKKEAGSRSLLIGEAYYAGESIQNLGERYQVEPGTILSHLFKFAAAGNDLRQDDELARLASISDAQQQEVLQAFAELGTAFLKPVFEKMNGTVGYDDLRVLRLMALIGQVSEGA